MQGNHESRSAAGEHLAVVAVPKQVVVPGKSVGGRYRQGYHEPHQLGWCAIVGQGYAAGFDGVRTAYDATVGQLVLGPRHEGGWFELHAENRGGGRCP